MNLSLLRFSPRPDDTLGLLLMERDFACFTLEDEYRSVKVPGETCIPDGRYEIQLRAEGGMHQKYRERFRDIHYGMLWLQDVPDFEWIYLHCGNRDEHTDGCILVGDTAQQNVTEDGFIGGSTSAYRRIYPPIVEAIRSGEGATITIRKVIQS